MNKKKKCVSWNGEINLGHILTILTIIIAIIALSYQRLDLSAKVNDLDAVVRELEEEKFQRKIQGLEQSAELSKHFSFTLGNTTDRLRDINSQNDNEFIFLLSEINEIIDLLLKGKDLTSLEREKLKLLKDRNYNKRLIYIFGRKYDYEVSQFENTNEPKEGDCKGTDDYINAKRHYADTLGKHTNMLLQLLKNSIEEPKKKVIDAEEKFWNYE
jgi:hypothetical protein